MDSGTVIALHHSGASASTQPHRASRPFAHICLNRVPKMHESEVFDARMSSRYMVLWLEGTERAVEA